MRLFLGIRYALCALHIVHIPAGPMLSAHIARQGTVQCLGSERCVWHSERDCFTIDTTVAADTPLVPFTQDFLRRFLALRRDLNVFWQTHRALYDTAQAHPVSSPVFTPTTVGPIKVVVTNVVRTYDYTTWAVRQPAIARIFRVHHIAPQQYRALVVTIYNALHDEGSPTTTVAGRNAQLLKAHAHEIRVVMTGPNMPAAKQQAGQPQGTSESHQVPDTVIALQTALAGQVGTLAQSLAVTARLNVPAQAALVHFGDGHIYVLGFTGYWCEGCPSTYGPLTILAKRYAQQGVRVMLVTAFYGVDLDFLRAYFQHYHVTLPVMIEGTPNDDSEAGWHPAHYQRFGVSSLPQTVVIDQHGVIRFHDGEGLTSLLDSLVQAGR